MLLSTYNDFEVEIHGAVDNAAYRQYCLEHQERLRSLLLHEYELPIHLVHLAMVSVAKRYKKTYEWFY